MYGKSVWVLNHDWRVFDAWYDDMRWIWMVVRWNSMLGKFWGSFGLTVMLPSFRQNCGLRNISCTYVSYPWMQCIENEWCNIKYHVMKIKEMFGHDPSKGKVIH